MNQKFKITELCKEINQNKDEAATIVEHMKQTPSTSTPKKNATEEASDEYASPTGPRLTQDSYEDDELDVIWDWESPHTNRRCRAIRKRFAHSSPNIPRKQPTTNSYLPRFSSFKAELEVLESKLTSTESACDNQQRVFLKPKVPLTPTETNDTKDLFDDDSFDEALFKCSQQVEATNPLTTNTIQDDSFDVLMGKINDKEIESLTQSKISNIASATSALSPRSIGRRNSEPIESFGSRKPPLFTKKLVSTYTNTTSFPRTKSEDLSQVTDATMDTKIKCSPEEIEQKRHEAKARLAWKMKYNEIEKRRQEALERLKRNRLQKIISKQNNNT